MVFGLVTIEIWVDLDYTSIHKKNYVIKIITKLLFQLKIIFVN
jgi:hypothetical protein